MRVRDRRLVETLGISPHLIDGPPAAMRSSQLLRAGWHGLRQIAPRRRFVAGYVWLELDLDAAVPPQLPLPRGYAVRTGDAEDVVDLRELRHAHVTTMTAELVARRSSAGNALWLATTEDERVASSCWAFVRTLPVHESRLALAPGVVAIEDVVSAGWARGRGIAPALWSSVAATYANRGATAILAKVDVSNTSSRRAFAKAGFCEIARMRITWRDWRTATEVVLPAGDTSHAWLEQLACSPRLPRR